MRPTGGTVGVIGMETRAEGLPRDQPTSDRLSTYRLGLERRFDSLTGGDVTRLPKLAGARSTGPVGTPHIAGAPRRSLEPDHNRLGDPGGLCKEGSPNTWASHRALPFLQPAAAGTPLPNRRQGPWWLWPLRALVHLTRRLDGVFKANLDRDQSIAASARKERRGLLGH